jgi:hypothetical protein
MRLRPDVVVCFEHGWMKADGRIPVKDISRPLLRWWAAMPRRPF